MDSPQMYDSNQGNQANGVMNSDMKKTPMNTSPSNNNTSNTNNNNLTTLNNNTGTTKQTAALLKQHQLAQQYQTHGGDLSDLNTPEISLDLQNLIDESQFGDGLFSDILAQNPGMAGKHVQNLHGGAGRQIMQASAASRYPSTTLAYMPQPVHSGAASGGGSYVAAGGNAPNGQNSDSNSSMGSDVPSIKEEPVDPQEYRRQCAAAGYMPGGYTTNAPTFATLAPGGVLHHQHHQLQGLGGATPGASLPGMKSIRNGAMHHPHPHGHHAAGARKSMKPADKSSDEYRRRRERNNIAVRKSREKAKVRTRETEEKVKLLVKENERLQKRIELLTEELNVLRSLFSNVGVLPEHLHREINKHLDSFQLQHQQQHM